MRNIAARRRGSANASATAMGKKFGRYKEEIGKAVRKADVKHSKGLQGIIKAWKAYKRDERSGDTYRPPSDCLKGLDYDAGDVEKFCVAIADFQDYFLNIDGSVNTSRSEDLGRFISALVNDGKDDDYVIITRHLRMPIHHLGYQNTKNVTIEGDAGNLLGTDMEDGTIRVKGNVGEYAGCGMKGGRIAMNNAGAEAGYQMKGGEILIEGNAGRCLGTGMEDGLITVKGNAGDFVGASMRGGKIIVNNAGNDVGTKMEGGEIHIEGKYRSIGNVASGLADALTVVGGGFLTAGALCGGVILGIGAAFGSSTPLFFRLLSGVMSVAALTAGVWLAEEGWDNFRQAIYGLRYFREIYGGKIYRKGKLKYKKTNCRR